MKASTFRFGFVNGSIVSLLLASIPAGAQIIPDNTLPSVVRPGEENTTLIEQGSISSDGENLFHSFQEFSIQFGNTARFIHDSDIKNIFTRVTGGASEINGTIETLINGTTNELGSANLFIINPRGITFGENARLNIGGSFIASTADSIKFANEAEFSVTNPQSSPLLIIGVPVGLQFGSNPGEIVNRSMVNGDRNIFGLPIGLKVPDGKTLALVGGNLSLKGGNLTATEGRIDLGSVGGNSFVSLDETDYALGYTGVQNFGDITIQNASVDAGGAIQVQGKDITLMGSQIFASTEGSTQGKDLVINASNSLELSQGALIATDATGEAKGGNAIVKASEVNLSEGTQIGTFATDEAKGGNVIVKASEVNLSEGALITTDATGEAKGGDVIIMDTSSLNLIGENTQIATSASEQGEAGNVMIMETSEVKLSEGALIRTSVVDEAKAGDVIVKADSIELIGTFSQGMQSRPSAFSTEAIGTNNSGNITVETRQLSIKDGANITASTGNEGNAGNIEVKASDIQLEGTAPDGDSPSGIFAQVREGVENPGNAGTITIETNGLTLKAGAQINSVARGNTKAGSVTINATDFITLTGISPTTIAEQGGSAIFATAEGEGNATPGEVNITTGLLTVEQGGRVSTTNLTNGEGSGSLTLNVDNLVIRDGGTVETQTFGGSAGGDLTINAKDSVEVSGIGFFENIVGSFERNSNISVSSTGTGAAGNLEIAANSIKLDNQGEIIGETRNTADGGNITLKNLNESLFLRRGSRISTTAGTDDAGGDGGNISIQSEDGFIFAVPSENSDITANAFTGEGGRVDINANGIYGIEFREEESPQTNDITASSQFGTDGIVELDIPEIDPNSGLLELPIIPTDTEVAQGCYSPGFAQSSFFFTGRGGLPPNPKDILTPDATQVDWVSVKPSNNDRSLPPVTNKQTTSTPKQIVQATGAILNAKGQIVLSANPSNITSDNISRKKPIPCQNN